MGNGGEEVAGTESEPFVVFPGNRCCPVNQLNPREVSE